LNLRPLLAALAAVILAPTAAAADWPTPAQIELVKQRRASFPVATLVSSIDWYSPRETVPGAKQPTPLPLRPAEKRHLKPATVDAALALADRFKSHALLVWQAGALEIEHYGVGFGPTSRFDTASMHKPVAALLLGAAIADGKIGSVDDPLGRYVPGLPPERAKLPLRALLEMASGLETPPVSNDPASPYWQSVFGDDLQAAIAHWPQSGAPYERFYYANANTQFVAWAIERATGERYAAYLSRRLWAPLGAADARVWLDHEGGSARGFCCLQASARDWLRVGLLILNQGRVGERALVPASHVGHMVAPSQANPNFGWQIWRGSPYLAQRWYTPDLPVRIPAAEPFAASDVVYIDGSGGQRVYIVPSRQLVAVRIGPPSRSWDDAELPNLLLRGLR
jgi:CubicO group peptidase (beta-lactamase class C family)